MLAAVSVVILRVGWSASNRSKILEQNLSIEALGRRLAKAEGIGAQLQGELSVVTDRMKLTQADMNRARSQAKQLKEDNDKQLANLQNNVSGELATKATSADVNTIASDVAEVKSDLDTTTRRFRYLHRQESQ
jgi:uncharacterized coiled-coil protein SlyX